MAFNPPLHRNQVPKQVPGDEIVAHIESVVCEVIGSDGLFYTGTGPLYVSYLRMVFINARTSEFQAFDFPFAYMRDFREEEGMGFTGYVRMLANPHSPPAFFRILLSPSEFRSIIQFIYSSLKKFSTQKPTTPHENIGHIGYMDNEDPTVVYLPSNCK